MPRVDLAMRCVLGRFHSTGNQHTTPVTPKVYGSFGTITDACWASSIHAESSSLDNMLFVAAGGSVSILQGSGQDYSIVCQFQRGNLETVVPLHYAASAITLACSSNGGRTVTAWKYVPATGTAECVQEITIVGGGSSAATPGPEFVLGATATRERALVVASHASPTPSLAVFSSDAETGRLTHVTVFDIAYPVLSFTTLAPLRGHNGAATLYVWLCVCARACVCVRVCSRLGVQLHQGVCANASGATVLHPSPCLRGGALHV